MSTSSKIIALLVVVLAIIVGIDKVYDAGFDAGERKLADKTREEADRDWSAKLETAQKRIDALTTAAHAASGQLAELEKVNDDYKVRIAAGDRINAGLRTTLVSARRSEVRSNPGSACSSQELRSERIAGALEDLQRQCVEVADRTNELEGQLLACDSGARRDAVMLRWALGSMAAMRIGAEAPSVPVEP